MKLAPVAKPVTRDAGSVSCYLCYFPCCKRLNALIHFWCTVGRVGRSCGSSDGKVGLYPWICVGVVFVVHQEWRAWEGWMSP